jgi:hypothetical protein
MTQATFNQILNQLETLNMDELQQLQQSIQFRLIHQKKSQRSVFHEVLLASGLVQQIKCQSSEQPTERKLVQIQGQAISETILEERR